jgi:hypothetical protein
VSNPADRRPAGDRFATSPTSRSSARRFWATVGPAAARFAASWYGACVGIAMSALNRWRRRSAWRTRTALIVVVAGPSPRSDRDDPLAGLERDSSSARGAVRRQRSRSHLRVTLTLMFPVHTLVQAVGTGLISADGRLVPSPEGESCNQAGNDYKPFRWCAR